MRKGNRRILWAGGAVVLVGGLAAGYSALRGDAPEKQRESISVERRTIVDKALAVGTIDPETEVSIKSKVSGVVQRLYAEAGDYVKAGAPLLEVRPDPTPLELAEATRDVEMKKIAWTTAKREMERNQALLTQNLLSRKEFEDANQQFQEAELRYSIARERLALIEKGRVKIANTSIESVVKAPITGYVLEKTIDIGDPVVPLSTYQEGTVLMTMADMGTLIFRGTVDEIDVGRLSEGLAARIDVGAIPGDDEIEGTLHKISLKANRENNATVFPVEIELTMRNGSVLRAGYSANASIIVARRENVLSVPERVVTFRNDSAFVRIPDGTDSSREVFIETGLSDAIHVEILSGLNEGDEVLEKPLKKIE